MLGRVGKHAVASAQPYVVCHIHQANTGSTVLCGTLFEKADHSRCVVISGLQSKSRAVLSFYEDLRQD